MSQASGRKAELRGGRAASAGVQLQGVLDQLFYYPGPLGAEVGPHGVALRVWAPTAQQVSPYLPYILLLCHGHTCVSRARAGALGRKAVWCNKCSA